jgi:hypothetical protein
MNDGTDVFRVLGWGVRKYAWVVVALMVALGLAVPAAVARTPQRFDAQAEVGPSRVVKLNNLDALPRLGTTVFNNGAVAEAVRAAARPPLPASAPVVPQRVELVAAQDNLVFTVVGHGTTPQAAQQHANVAAEAFTQELNKYSAAIGAFAIQRLASPPVTPVNGVSTTVAVGMGLLAGAAAGLGVVALLLVLRRPVRDVTSAEVLTGTPVLGRLVLGGPGRGLRGLPQLCRRILRQRVDTVLLTGPHETARVRKLLAAGLAEMLEDTRALVAPQDGPPEAEGAPLRVVEEPSALDLATRADTSLVLVVVKEGIAAARLRRQAEQFLDGGPAGLVMVRPSVSMRLSRRRPPSAQEPPGATPSAEQQATTSSMSE